MMYFQNLNNFEVLVTYTNILLFIVINLNYLIIINVIDMKICAEVRFKHFCQKCINLKL